MRFWIVTSRPEVGSIRHDQRGPGEHGQSDQYPLEHASGELMGVRAVDPLGIGETDQFEGLEDARPPRGGVAFLE